MPNIIELNLLENRSIVAKKQGIPLANENSYKVIEGEKNTTYFVIKSVPAQYENARLTVEMVNAKGYGVKEKDIGEVEIDLDTYKGFVLPIGMAVKGYGQISITAYMGEERTPFQPLKVKVWETIDGWEEGVNQGGSSGGSDVDLTNYYTKPQTDELLDEKADKSELNNKADKSQLADYATKEYVDDKAPNITVDSSLSNTSTNPVQNKVIKTAIDDLRGQINEGGGGLTEKEVEDIVNGKGYATEDYVDGGINSLAEELRGEIPTVQDWAKAQNKPTYTYSEITGRPTLATVATTGSYNDLMNKPTIPPAYTLPQATSTALGGIKVGYSKNGKNYPVALDTNGNAYVNVPWEGGGTGGDGVTEEKVLDTIEMKLSSDDPLYARTDLDTENKTIVGAINEVNAKVATGGGGGQAIIDVVELPTEEINEQAFYRVQTVQFVNAAVESAGLSPNIIVVPEKPETGVSAMNIETGAITGYLDLSDSKLYGYVDDTLRATMISMGLTEFVLDTYIINGWAEFHRLVEMWYTKSEPTGLFSWGGIIQSRDEAIDGMTLYVVLRLGLFHYKDGWHPVCDDEKGSASSGGSVGEPSIILAGHRYYGESGKLALRNLTGVTRIDWGDGTVEDFDEGSAEDTYTHQWKVNEDIQLPSGFEIRIYGCTKIGASAFKVQDTFNDVGNQYITTIVIRSGIEDIGSTINPGYVTDNQVTVIMDRYSPPHIISDTSNSNSFDANVTKIIVPSKSVIAAYNTYWNNAYASIIQALLTEAPKLYKISGEIRAYDTGWVPCGVANFEAVVQNADNITDMSPFYQLYEGVNGLINLRLYPSTSPYAIAYPIGVKKVSSTHYTIWGIDSDGAVVDCSTTGIHANIENITITEN